MSLLLQEISSKQQLGTMVNERDLSRYTPSEICQTIQALMRDGRDEFAYLMGEAALNLYPYSEDILAVTGLLASTRQDWSLAVELLEELKRMQGENSPLLTFVVLARSLRCNLEPARAFEVVEEGLKRFPDHEELVSERAFLANFNDSHHPVSHHKS
jgi:uncharacterized protein HemY